MPVIRSMPAVKPVKTERTHEENQERAYIAASRRSDRSLEARVESARRASEIHKKRTGRSLRVREEDVMNEEMYEEEDDDLPMQYRRINALNPHLSYAFAERLNNYVNGQIGVRNVLQQAIAQSNQYTQNQQLLQSYMQTNGCFGGTNSPNGQGVPQSPWTPGNMQGSPTNFQSPATAFARPSNASNYPYQTQPTPNSAASPATMDSRRPSQQAHMAPATAQSPTAPFSYQPFHSQPASPQLKHKASRSPQQYPSPPQSVSSAQPNMPTASSSQMMGSQRSGVDSLMGPFTTALPNETLQILQGTQAVNPVYWPNQMNVSMPAMGKYSYNPNGKPRSTSGSPTEQQPAPPKQFAYEGLDQTLTLDRNNTTFPQYPDPMPTANASLASEMPFDINAFGQYSGFGANDAFGSLDFSGGFDGGDAFASGFATPNDATFGEYFNFNPSPE